MFDNCKDCGKCCIETEMIVSKQDINLIKRKCFERINMREFVFKDKDGLFQLKNIEGYCVFFDKVSKGCTIYEYRPQGCRYYPLIFDSYLKKCILDKDCPRSQLFYQNQLELINACHNLKKFLKKQLKIEVD